MIKKKYHIFEGNIHKSFNLVLPLFFPAPVFLMSDDQPCISLYLTKSLDWYSNFCGVGLVWEKMSVCLEVDFAKLFYSQLCSSLIGPGKRFSMPYVLDYFMVRWLDHYGYEYEYFGDTSNFFVFCEKHRKTVKKGRALLNPENDDCKFFMKKKTKAIIPWKKDKTWIGMCQFF